MKWPKNLGIELVSLPLGTHVFQPGLYPSWMLAIVSAVGFTLIALAQAKGQHDPAD